VARYKSLADIERGFRVLKSEIEIAPMFHRLPERMKAHASLCFMGLIIYRVMRQRLRLAKRNLSPKSSLAAIEARPATQRQHQRHPLRASPLFTKPRPPFWPISNLRNQFARQTMAWSSDALLALFGILQ
jgi:hypothetical protein